jgi:hypothetical protein
MRRAILFVLGVDFLIVAAALAWELIPLQVLIGDGESAGSDAP